MSVASALFERIFRASPAEAENVTERLIRDMLDLDTGERTQLIHKFLTEQNPLHQTLTDAYKKVVGTAESSLDYERAQISALMESNDALMSQRRYFGMLNQAVEMERGRAVHAAVPPAAQDTLHPPGSWPKDNVFPPFDEQGTVPLTAREYPPTVTTTPTGRTPIGPILPQQEPLAPMTSVNGVHQHFESITERELSKTQLSPELQAVVENARAIAHKGTGPGTTLAPDLVEPVSNRLSPQDPNIAARIQTELATHTAYDPTKLSKDSRGALEKLLGKVEVGQDGKEVVTPGVFELLMDSSTPPTMSAAEAKKYAHLGIGNNNFARLLIDAGVPVEALQRGGEESAGDKLRLIGNDFTYASRRKYVVAAVDAMFPIKGKTSLPGDLGRAAKEYLQSRGALAQRLSYIFHPDRAERLAPKPGIFELVKRVAPKIFGKNIHLDQMLDPMADPTSGLLGKLFPPGFGLPVSRYTVLPQPGGEGHLQSVRASVMPLSDSTFGISFTRRFKRGQFIMLHPKVGKAVGITERGVGLISEAERKTRMDFRNADAKAIASRGKAKEPLRDLIKNPKRIPIAQPTPVPGKIDLSTPWIIVDEVSVLRPGRRAGQKDAFSHGVVVMPWDEANRTVQLPEMVVTLGKTTPFDILSTEDESVIASRMFPDERGIKHSLAYFNSHVDRVANNAATGINRLWSQQQINSLGEAGHNLWMAVDSTSGKYKGLYQDRTEVVKLLTEGNTYVRELPIGRRAAWEEPLKDAAQERYAVSYAGRIRSAAQHEYLGIIDEVTTLSTGLLSNDEGLRASTERTLANLIAETKPEFEAREKHYLVGMMNKLFNKLPKDLGTGIWKLGGSAHELVGNIDHPNTLELLDEKVDVIMDRIRGGLTSGTLTPEMEAIAKKATMLAMARTLSPEIVDGQLRRPMVNRALAHLTEVSIGTKSTSQSVAESLTPGARLKNVTSMRRKELTGDYVRRQLGEDPTSYLTQIVSKHINDYVKQGFDYISLEAVHLGGDELPLIYLKARSPYSGMPVNVRVNLASTLLAEAPDPLTKEAKRVLSAADAKRAIDETVDRIMKEGPEQPGMCRYEDLT